MSEADKTVVLSLGEREYTILAPEGKLSTRQISQMFQVRVTLQSDHGFQSYSAFNVQIQPQGVWLRCQFSNRAYWPTENGEFNLSSEGEYTQLIVEGPPAVSPYLPGAELTFGSPILPSGPSNPPSLTMSAIGLPKAASRSSYSGFQSVVSTASSARRKGFVTIKMVLAKMIRHTDKIQFEKREQMFIFITEATATLPYILAQVKELAGEEHIIVTCDGLEIKDSSGTEGIM